MMKTTCIILLAFLFPFISSGQPETKLGIDCNPKLNSAEINYFKEIFGLDAFSLQNKNIGFATNGRSNILSFENSFMPISKKVYFTLTHNDLKQSLKSKIIVLDSIQKQTTKGFDVIVLVFDKKYQKKAEQGNFKRIITIFGYRELNYPDNLNQVGNDTLNVLSQQDASFLNQIFNRSRGAFDFNGKKIAIIKTQTKSIISKSEFIAKVKKHLGSDFLYPYDFLYILNETEKKATGGYDAVIIYDCLKCGGEDAVALLKINGT